MDESEGEFSEERAAVTPCRRCGSKNVNVRTWESHCGGYEDLKYTCQVCDYSWWIEGPDS